MLDRYKPFLTPLNNQAERKQLEELTVEDAARADTVFAKAREARKHFGIGIERVLFDGEGSPFPTWTRRYGVF